MKRGIASLFLLLTICMAGCNASESDASEGMEKSAVDMSKVNSEVTMTINEEKISEPYPECITLIYTNNSDKNYSYGNKGATLEKKINNEWYKVPWYEVPLAENYASTDVGYILPSHSMREDSLYLMGYLDNLNTGEYRIVKVMEEDLGIMREYSYTESEMKHLLSIGGGVILQERLYKKTFIFAEFIVE